MKRVLVVGGGITGLTLARRLAALQHSVTIVEQSHRMGGWMRSNQQDGFTFEHGPNSLRVSGGANTIHLINQLGIADQVVMPSKESRTRFVMHDAAMVAMGRIGMVSVPSLLLPLITSGISEWSAPSSDVDDESIYDFFARRFNSRVADTVADALVTGVFAGDPRQLSMRTCFPAIWNGVRQYGSITRWIWSTRNDAEIWPPIQVPGESPWLAAAASHLQNRLHAQQEGVAATQIPSALKPPTLLSPSSFRSVGASQYSFREGIATLPTELEKQLRQNPRVHMGESVLVTSMTPHSSTVTSGVSQAGTIAGGMEVGFQRRHGSAWLPVTRRTFDHVYITTPAHALANILDPPHLHDESTTSTSSTTASASTLQTLVRDLRSMSYASVWTVSMGWKQSELIAPSRRGFGVLVPHRENKPYLGVIFNSAVFPDQSKTTTGDTRITVLIGGARRRDLIAASRSDIEEIACKAARDVGISGDADVIRARLARGCIPQHPVGYHHTCARLENNIHEWSHGRCHLLGPLTGGVSINACITQAMTTKLFY